MGVVIGVVALASGAMSAVRYVKHASATAKLNSMIARNYPLGTDALFKGQYVLDNEASRFNWCPDGSSSSVRCCLELSPSAQQAWSDLGVGTFDIEFNGKILEKHGRKSPCDYSIHVTKTISSVRAEESAA